MIWFLNTHQGTPKAIGSITDTESFGLPLPKTNNEGGAYVYRLNTRPFSLKSLLTLRSNAPDITALFDQDGQMRNPILSPRLNEFTKIVIAQEHRDGINVRKAHYALMAVDEIVGKKVTSGDFILGSTLSKLHRDDPLFPSTRVYVVSDEIAPTRIVCNGEIVTAKPWEVWRMYGRTLHGRGAIIDIDAARSKGVRAFARIIATNG